MKKLGFVLALALSCCMSVTAFAGGMSKSGYSFSDNGQCYAVDGNEAFLDSLTATDSTQRVLMMESFSPKKLNYEVTVQSDIYGVLVKPVAEKGAEIKVTASVTPGAYGEHDENKPLVIEKSDKGYIVPLTQTYEGYDSEFVQNVTIDVKKGSGTRTYTLKITRECDKNVYNLFKQEKFTAADGTVLDYNIYVPTNYNPGKQYPVVLALHGGGQRVQPVDMVLKRYQMATIWAKDSEAGRNECIVVAPHTSDTWATEHTGKLSKDGEAAVELVKSLSSRYNVDSRRYYVLGASMGGVGTMAVLYNYPSLFAGAIPCCAVGVNDYSGFGPMSDRILYCHAMDDPTVNYQNGLDIMNGLKNANVKFNKCIYPKGSFFYPSAHFSWVPAYGTETNRNWLFTKVR